MTNNEIMRKLLDLIAEIEEANQAEAAMQDQEKMMPPLQQALELQKKTAGVNSEFDQDLAMYDYFGDPMQDYMAYDEDEMDIDYLRKLSGISSGCGCGG